MKNENNFIRESQTQPGNSYQCEHREPRGAASQSGPREEPIDYVFLEPWPVLSTVPLLVKQALGRKQQSITHMVPGATLELKPSSA